jgi:biofilm PGA synthesis lipoprotein PgaB
LSIFDPESVALIGSIYDSLGKYTHFDGVLFHDDAYFSDFEDMHPEALRYYKTQGINFQTVSEIHQDESLMRRWTDLKVDAWNNFTDQMMKRVRYFRSGEGAPLRSARNLYASVALNPESEQWFAQSLLKSIQHYDHVALMAMPYMENAADPQEWLADLYDAVNKALGGTDKVIFELQTRDWRNQTNIPTETLVAQFRQFYLKGAMNVAYYPDDFLNDHPKLEILRPGFSTENYPYRQQ